MNDSIDVEDLNYIEDEKHRRMYYRYTPAKEAKNAPILIILHGHGSNRASKFKDPFWNVIAPIDHYGKNSLGSWWLGENGDYFVLKLLHKLIKKIQDETQSTEGLYFWGSSMGGYGALLHGMILNAQAVYANIPQIKLLDFTYSENGMKKFFEYIFSSDTTNNKYNDITNFLNTNFPSKNPMFFIAQSKYDYKNYMSEHALYFTDKCKKNGISVDLEVFETDRHKLLLPVHEAIKKLAQHYNESRKRTFIQDIRGLIFSDNLSYAKFPEIRFDANSKWKLKIYFKEQENDVDINFFFGERGSRYHGFARVKNKLYYRLGDGSYIGGLSYTVGELIAFEVHYDHGKWIFSDGTNTVQAENHTDVYWNAIGSGFNGKEHEEKIAIYHVEISEYSEENSKYVPKAIWKLNEQKGCIAFDSSGNHYHAVLSNAKWFVDQEEETFEEEHLLYPLAKADWKTYVEKLPTKTYDALRKIEKKEKNVFIWKNLQYLLNKKNAEKGYAILQNIYILDRFEAVELKDELTWKENPLNNRTWMWNYHQLIFASYLLAAYEHTKENQYLDKLFSVLQSWYRSNYAEEPSSEMSWHDHSTALRLGQLINIWEYMHHTSYNMPDELIDVFYNLVETHCNVLASEAFYMKHNNHGFDQSYYLYLASNVFPELENAKEWRDIALDRLIDEIRIAFTPEGMHIENSPAYLVGMLQRVDLASRMIHYYEKEKSITLELIVDNALKVLAYMMQPDGKLPMIGDTDNTNTVPAFKHFKELQNYKLFEYAKTFGKSGSVDGYSPDMVLKESGYAILRDKWHSQKSYNEMIHLVFKCSFLSTFHRHDDDLNFLLFAFGEEWFVDGGIYKYDEKDPYRKYLRSARAHNIPVIPGVEANRIIPNDPQKTSKITDYELGEDYSWVEAKSYMYEGYCVTRKIEYFRPRQITITDNVYTENDETLNSYDLMFHIPLDKKIDIAGNKVSIQGKTGHIVTMQFSGECHYMLHLHTGETENGIFGWQSKVFGKVEPIQTLVCSVVAKNSDCDTTTTTNITLQ